MKRVLLMAIFLSFKSFAFEVDLTSCPLLTDSKKEVQTSKIYQETITEGETAYSEFLSLFDTERNNVVTVSSYHTDPFTTISTLRVPKVLFEKKFERGTDPCNRDEYKRISSALVRACQSDSDARRAFCSTTCVQKVDFGYNTDCR